MLVALGVCSSQTVSFPDSVYVLIDLGMRLYFCYLCIVPVHVLTHINVLKVVTRTSIRTWKKMMTLQMVGVFVAC